MVGSVVAQCEVASGSAAQILRPKVRYAGRNRNNPMASGTARIQPHMPMAPNRLAPADSLTLIFWEVLVPDRTDGIRLTTACGNSASLFRYRPCQLG